MEPLRNITWGLQFAAQQSPLWLLLLIPVVAALAWYLYRRQSHDVAPVHAVGLAVLRCLLVVVLMFLAFRPSLVRKEILRFPARLLVLFDDSESMSVPDPRLPASEALRIARMDEEENEGKGDDGAIQPPHRLAKSLALVRAELATFRRYSKEADRSLDQFWTRADSFESGVRDRYEALAKAIPAISKENPAVGEPAANAAELLASLREDLSTLTTGNRHPGSAAFDAYARQLETVREALLDIQEKLDEQTMQGESSAADRLRERLDETRSAPRTELVYRALKKIAAAGETELGNQFLQYQSLATGERAKEVPSVQAAVGPSAILREVQSIVEEDHDFPLSAVLMLSDGRDTEGGDMGTIFRVASRNQTPVYSVPFGGEQEPPDLAVLDVRTPPIAVSGRQVDVRVLLKTAPPSGAPETAVVKLLDSTGAVVGEQTVALGEQERAQVVFSLTPGEVGVNRYRVELESVEGEVIAARNNRAQFALRVRDEPVNVLFLDAKPRWETRFALNVLRRLDYVQLNSIVALTRKGKEVVRGAERGQWPADLSGLQMYDLIILGNVPEDTLGEDDWKALQMFVREKGGTLCFLNGMGGAASRRAVREADLYPLTEAASESVSNEGRLSARFRLTPGGEHHAVTRGLSAALPLDAEVATGQLAPRTVALLADEATNRAVAACRFAEAGRTLALDTSLLWKRLNTSHLQVHENLFLNLVSWAADVELREEAEGAEDDDENDASGVWAGERILEQEKVKQVLGGDELLGTTLTMVDESGENVEEVEFVPLAGANGVCAAQFPRLVPSAYRLQLDGEDILPSYRLEISERAKELRLFARNTVLLERLADGTGGAVVPVYDVDAVLPRIAPKVRVEEHRSVFRLWDAVSILFVLIGALSIEWIWRKLAGLI